jgi:hypothetical protein
MAAREKEAGLSFGPGNFFLGGLTASHLLRNAGDTFGIATVNFVFAEHFCGSGGELLGRAHGRTPMGWGWGE